MTYCQRSVKEQGNISPLFSGSESRVYVGRRGIAPILFNLLLFIKLFFFL